MQDSAPRAWLDEAIQEYPAGLYQWHGIARGAHGLDSVSESNLESFYEQGYLVMEHAFTPGEVKESIEGLLNLLSGANPDFKGVQYEAGVGSILPSAPEERQDMVRKFMSFVDYDARLKALAEHPGLLSLLSRLMSDTPTLFQDMALLKTPRLGREKPWHQDLAYFNLEPGTMVIGVWIALDEATTENGCMCVIPGSHREGPVAHFQRRDWQICDDQVARRAIAVPLPPGGCLLFHGLLHHGTPANHSPHRRRALQFHYKPAGARSVPQEDRMAAFGSEGKDVNC